MSLVGKWMLIAALVALPGCGRDGGQPPGNTVSVVAPQAPADVPVDALQARAEAALRERRYYAPVGDSAIDHYLALRERRSDDPGVAAALTELQPYLLIAGEQALANGDLAETNRLLALLARVDDGAPALPRLRDGLRRAEQAQQLLASGAADTAAAATESARIAEATRKLAAAAASATVADSRNTVAVAPTPAPASRPQPAPIEPATVPRLASASLVPAPAAALAAVPSALPKLLKDAQPRYPLSALNRKIEGSVQVAFTIQPDGSVADPRLLSANPAGIFNEAALAAVARWRFEATGRRVDTQRTLSFRLPKG